MAAGLYDITNQTLGKGHFAVVKLAKHCLTGLTFIITIIIVFIYISIYNVFQSEFQNILNILIIFFLQ
jgi:hypothetical protein